MIKDIIQSWLDETQKDMVVKYDQLGFRASGDWEKALENLVIESTTGYHATIKGANYTYWMENGRKAGKFPPRNAILDWINQKGIVAEGISNNSLAFLIARKIAREGTKVRPGLISDVLTQDRINKLIQDIGVFYTAQIKSDVIKTFK